MQRSETITIYLLHVFSTVLNVDVVVQSRDWIGLDKENLVSVLKRSDLVVKSEYELLKAVVRWLQDEARIHDLHSNLTAVLPYIRSVWISY